MSIQAPKTVIALDVGDKRIGAASASLIARLPNPVGVIEHSTAVYEEIAKMAAQHEAVAVVIGLPRGLNGQETTQTKHIRTFAHNLEAHLDIPIHLQDEALTSKQAEQELAGKGLYNKGAVDALAATYILEDFLAEHPELMA